MARKKYSTDVTIAAVLLLLAILAAVGTLSVISTTRQEKACVAAGGKVEGVYYKTPYIRCVK